MTRLEENKKVIDVALGKAESLVHNPPKTYEETVTFHLGVISTMLADISKSLAVIANKAEMDEKRDE